MSTVAMDSRRTRVMQLCFFALCAATTIPLWSASYLPIQDLPQHLAAISVLHHYDDPSFGFARYFEVDLFRTQYLAYYLSAHWLAYVFGIELANRLLVAGCVIATPYAIAALLRALGRDPRLALFSLPLAYNAHLILGFVNFLLAIPLAFLGLALAVKQRRAYSHARAVGLACCAIVCFYSHVVPFALLCTGVGLIALQRNLEALALSLLPLLPAGVAALAWASRSPAGQATITAARGTSDAIKPMYQPAASAMRDLPNWLTDILHGDDDARLLRAVLALFALALLAGLFRKRPDAPDALGTSLTLRLSILPLMAAVAYFVAPTSYAWIWPIAQRFPLLALLFVIPVLPTPPRYVFETLLALVLLVSAAQTKLVRDAFVAFDRDEVGDFDRALAQIPANRRVAGLIYTRGSRQVKFSPFIHYVAYYQARKGGAVMFTFADFPQSPFSFREGNRPPRVAPRWEWTPERVRPNDLAWYDYVLVRGHASSLARSGSQFERIHAGRSFDVWKNLRSVPQPDILPAGSSR